MTERPDAEGDSPRPYSQGGSLQGPRQPGQRGRGRKEALDCFLMLRLLLSPRQVCSTISSIRVRGGDRRTDSVAALLLPLWGSGAGQTAPHSRWHLKVLLFYRNLRIVTLFKKIEVHILPKNA